MDLSPYLEYKLFKLIGLGVLAFLVCFVYRVVTGRSFIADQDQQADQEHASSAGRGLLSGPAKRAE